MAAAQQVIDPELRKMFKEKASSFAAAKELAAKAKANTGNFQTYPDGKYKCLLSGAEITKSANGRWQIKWENVAQEGEQTGNVNASYDGIDTDENFARALSKLKYFGLDISQLTIDELPSALQTIVSMQIVHLVAVVTKESKNDGQIYTNTYFNKVLGTMKGDEPTS